MTEKYPIETAIVEEYNKTTALGLTFDLLKSEVLNSLLTQPELHTLSFLDFEATLDICRNYSIKDSTHIMITTKIFCVLSIVYNHPKIMITRRSYHKWNAVFESYFSIDLIAFFVYYKLERFLDTLISFLKIDHSTSLLRNPENLYFIHLFCTHFSNDQSKTFLDYSEKHLTHYSDLIISERHFKFPFSNARTPEQDFLYIFLSTLTFTKAHLETLQSHLLYLKFLELPETQLLSSFDELKTIANLALFPESETFPFLTLLFTSPLFCALAFKNGHIYFLGYCDINTARLSRPEYFV